MENKNKIYIIVSIFILASLLLVVLFIWPLFKEIKKDSVDLISAKNDIVGLSAQISEVDNFNANYKTYKSNLERIDNLFIDVDNPVDFIKFLETTANVCQITSQVSLPPSSENPNDTAQNFIVFQFSSKGQFSRILDFTKRIENGPYLVEIENLNIQNADDKDVIKNYSSANFSATFGIKAFAKK